ncbi:Tip elongation aberrant protein 1 [Sphaceloma murrayae]|uniref:Tip elongation aberrant protein 1 n=1 Tax=Sphaceloma murrayae TaxID=2082308 RepID=A0A2K1QGV5_9PEZI|nr:Tip elongation aberrant protein 1 [Sphaceloma murrayae]
MPPFTLETRYPAAIALLLLSTLASNLPYNPTRIHLSSQPDGKPHAYIIQPGSDSTDSAQLSSLDLSDTIDSNNPKPKPLSSALPFVDSNKATAYTSFVDQSGNITVLAGDCSKGADGASLWRLKPDTGAQNGGNWSQDKVVAKDLKGQDSVSGANFLNSAVAFSELVGGNATDTDLYAFGGMCPDDGASDATWTNTAKYSNVMVTYSPQDDTKAEDDYKVALITSKGPPIAEAGMTMTPLSPTFSNTSGVQTQQQDFVVLGGHTQSAFINMSQVALFSLPQAIWSFLPVQQPAGAVSSSDKDFVTPRSGHTAVLSEDGRSIIIYGGWVGDVNTPASPQIAVLQIGSGYGGTGPWRWSTVATPSGSFSGGPGIYGHGAVMLPGNVMMVMGGYTISTPSSKLAKRAGPTTNTRTYLYNVTSNSWIPNYSAPPEALSAHSGDTATSSGLQTPSQRAGVGIGVTFGVIALAGAGVLYLWHSKRTKRQRMSRDSMAIAMTNEKRAWDDGWNSHTLTSGRTDYDPGSPEREAFPWLPDLAQGWRTHQAKTREVDSTGAFLNIPSPTRGLRRPSSGRNYQYQATPMEEPRMSVALTGIHPIVETDEEGYASAASSRPGTGDAQKRLLAAQEIFDRSKGVKRSNSVDDPFRDPEPNPLGSHPVSPEPENGINSSPFRGQPPIHALNIPPKKDRHQTSAHDWASSNSIADRSSAGRSSPTKSSSDERTLSSLSEMSSGSYQSARSIARTTSTRSQAFFGLSGAPRISPQPSPTEDRTFSFTPSTTAHRTNSLSRPRRTNSNSPTHDTAPSRHRSVTSPSRGHRKDYSFDALRSEGEILLGPTVLPVDPLIITKRDPRPASSLYSDHDVPGEDDDDGDITPTSPTRKRLNWVGSLRRALGSYNPIDLARSASASLSQPLGPDASPFSYSDRSRTPSPSKEVDALAEDTSVGVGVGVGAGTGTEKERPRPRRTASDSSAFLSAKRGKQDWAADGVSAWQPYRDEVDGGDWGVPEGHGTRRRSRRATEGRTKKGVSFVDQGDVVVRRYRDRVGDVRYRDREDEDEDEDQDEDGHGHEHGQGQHAARVRNGRDATGSGDEEWDIERAAAQRDVQVMFTVPKARLRVVNADPDRASMRSGSGGSKRSLGSPVVGGDGN